MTEPWPVEVGPRRGLRAPPPPPAYLSGWLGAFWRPHSLARSCHSPRTEGEGGVELSSFVSSSSDPSRLQPPHFLPTSLVACGELELHRRAQASELRPRRSRRARHRTDHGHGRHHPHGHRRHRQWDRPRALPLPGADVLPHLEEGVGGAVLGDPVRGDAAQLHDVGAVRPPRGAPPQHARHHHQRHRHGHPAHLRHPLPPLLRGGRPPQGPPPARRRGRLRRRRRRHGAHPRALARAQVHGRRRPLRPLRNRHVRRAARRHENGDPDEERGVHAPVPVAGVPGERHLLDRLRPHQIRPLHHHPQRVGRALRGGAAGPLRHLLQVHAADHRGAQAQGRPGRHDRGRRRRRQSRLQHQHRRLLMPAGGHRRGPGELSSGGHRPSLSFPKGWIDRCLTHPMINVLLSPSSSPR